MGGPVSNKTLMALMDVNHCKERKNSKICPCGRWQRAHSPLVPAPYFSHHSPLEGESRQTSRQARLPRWGHAAPRPLRFSWAAGRGRRFRCSPHRRDFGLAPSSCRLPLKGGVMRTSRCSSLRLRNGWGAFGIGGAREAKNMLISPLLNFSAQKFNNAVGY